MAGRGTGPDFVEALARGLDVLTCMGAGRPGMTLAEIATAANLARPTARRLLLTLAELGYVRADGPAFTSPPGLPGIAYASSLGLWDIARPHMAALVAQTRESSSMAQLDGADIVYVARVAVPKLITLGWTSAMVGPQTGGQGPFAAPPLPRVAEVLAEPSRSGLPPFPPPDHGRFAASWPRRARGWALADEDAPASARSRSVATAPARSARP
jgi:IclR family pca regulon transcriptional regulator